MRSTIKDRPYSLLARELKARISPERQKTILKNAGVSDSSWKAIMAGTRPVADKSLNDIAKQTLADDENQDSYLGYLRSINKPDSSITQLLRNGKAKLRIGYLDSPPFAYAARNGDNHPKGVLIELVELFLALVGVQYEWCRIPFNELISSIERREVDFITGFVLETPARRTRARFIPLDMPFSIGINGVTRNEKFETPLDFLELKHYLEEVNKPKEEKSQILTIDGELADDYFPSIFGKLEPDICVRDKTVAEAFDFYLNKDVNKSRNIVFADSMTCARVAPAGSHQVLVKKIGRFRGGFLFPLFDGAWGDYFSESFYGFLSSRLPGVGEIFLNSADKLEPFLETAESSENMLDKSTSTPTPSRGDFWTLESWMKVFWPMDVVPVPQDFAAKVREVR